MAQFSTTLVRSLPPLLAGLLLGTVGWLAGGRSGPEALDFQPQLVVRPATAELVAEKDGASPVSDSWLPGRYVFEEAGIPLEVRQKGWPATRLELEEPRGMTTVRVKAPTSVLAVSVKGDQKITTTLLELPKKSKLPLSKGRANLEPGRHELLLQAEGYLPKRLSVNLKPGEVKEVALSLERIPLPAGFSLPALRAGAPPAGWSAPGPAPDLPAATVTAPRPPVYSAPAYVPPSRPPAYEPAPVPRFTPVAPVAQPAPADPVPMFTPIP